MGCSYQHYNIGRNRSNSTWLRWNAYILKHTHTYSNIHVYKYVCYYHGLEHLRINHMNISIYPCNYLHWRGKAVTASSHRHRPHPGCHSDKPKRGRRHGDSRRDVQSIAPVMTKERKRSTQTAIRYFKHFSILTHLPLDKMAATLADDNFKYIFIILEMHFPERKIHLWILGLFPGFPLAINQHWFSQWVNTGRLKDTICPWWSSSPTHVCVVTVI